MSAVTHRFEITHNIGKACDKSASRYAFNSVLATPGGDMVVYLSATDGRQLTIVREEGTAPTETIIPMGALPKLAKRGKAAHVELNGEWRNSDSKVAPSADHTAGRFALVEQVIPELPADSVCLTLDVKILLKMAEAMGTDVLRLHLQPDNHGHIDKVIGVTNQDNGAFGVFMPLGGGKNMDNLQAERKRQIERYNEHRAEYVSAMESVRADKRDWNTQHAAMVADWESKMKAAQAGV